MSEKIKKRSAVITEFLNAALSSIQSVVPTDSKFNRPQLLDQNFHINFGVLIGVIGDLKGKLVLSGNTSTFSSIGEMMYEMPLEGGMLQSFNGGISFWIGNTSKSFKRFI